MATSFEQFRSVPPRTALWGAFPTRDGAAIHFSAGRAVRRRPSLRIIATDEGDVRKWPVPARLALIALSSLLLWIAIATLIAALS